MSFTDDSRALLNGKWFHGAYLANVLAPGVRVALFGKIEIDSYTGQLTVMHPEFEILTADEDPDSSLHTGRIVPIYEAAAKITTRIFRTMVSRILESLAPIPDALPEHIRARLKLPDRWTSIRTVHFPDESQDVRLLNAFRSQAHFRMIFEEFFWLECGLALKRAKARSCAGNRLRAE